MTSVESLDKLLVSSEFHSSQSARDDESRATLTSHYPWIHIICSMTSNPFPSKTAVISPPFEMGIVLLPALPNCVPVKPWTLSSPLWELTAIMWSSQTIFRDNERWQEKEPWSSHISLELSDLSNMQGSPAKVTEWLVNMTHTYCFKSQSLAHLLYGNMLIHMMWHQWNGELSSILVAVERPLD